jgi:hypothetical protein
MFILRLLLEVHMGVPFETEKADTTCKPTQASIIKIKTLIMSGYWNDCSGMHQRRTSITGASAEFGKRLRHSELKTTRLRSGSIGSRDKDQ